MIFFNSNSRFNPNVETEPPFLLTSPHLRTSEPNNENQNDILLEDLIKEANSNKTDDFDRTMKIVGLISSFVFIAFKVVSFVFMFAELTGSFVLGLVLAIGLLGASVFAAKILIDYLFEPLETQEPTEDHVEGIFFN